MGVPLKSAMITRAPDGKVTQWTGTITGRPLVDSPFEWRSLGSDVTCKGSTSGTGEGTMTCSNGMTMQFKVPLEIYGRLTASYAGTMADGTAYATGWGLDADFDKLQKMLPPR